jgi:hypothetical protein
MATSSRRGLESTASNPMTGRVAEMKPTPRSPRLGAFADAMLAVRDFINKAQIPQGVPLIGGEGLGSLILGRAPEELIEMSYGNMPVRVNPMAGRTASFVPEVKPGRSAQVADLLSLAGVPGGGRMAAAATGGLADFGTGAERAMLAYHGTPHRFERFDASKIGTGEGAQAYGHGIYFAESPDVARGYSLMGDQNPTAQQYLRMWGGDRAKAEAAFLKDVNEGAFGKYTSQIAKDGDVLASIRGKGQLYTVDIPDEMIPKMLDWDKPLSQQAPEVQEGLKKLMGPEWYGSWNNLQGVNAYDVIAGGRHGNPEGAAMAAKKLREVGIPGIRYLDQGSRGAGQGTSNFVVFPGEEQRVQILKRE